MSKPRIKKQVFLPIQAISGHCGCGETIFLLRDQPDLMCGLCGQKIQVDRIGSVELISEEAALYRLPPEAVDRQMTTMVADRG